MSSKEKIKIFIDGASFAHKSRGNQAMAISAFILFKKTFDADLSILSTNPIFDFKECKKRGFDVSINKRPHSSLLALLAFFKQCNKSDLIAGLYGDGFTWKRDLHCFNIISKLYLDLIIKLAIINVTKKQLIILPSSVGPFKDKVSSFIIRIFLNRAKLIMVREELSYNNLTEIGVNAEVIKRVPDVAFILPASSNKAIDIPIFKSTNNLLIGINVSQLINFESENYAALMARIADYLTIKFGAKVLLIPHDVLFSEINKLRIPTSKGIGGDDIDAVKAVYSRVRERQRIFPITTAYDVEVLKKIIGHCDIFIGARTHSIIAALSLAVPTIGIAYSHKTPGIMKLMGLENYVCNFKTMTFEELSLKIENLILEKDVVRLDLLVKAEILKNNVWNTSNLLRAVIDSRGDKT